MKYFDDEDFENMSFYTNLYAVQRNTITFKPTTSNEIKIFVAIIIVSEFYYFLIVLYLILPKQVT